MTRFFFHPALPPLTVVVLLLFLSLSVPLSAYPLTSSAFVEPQSQSLNRCPETSLPSKYQIMSSQSGDDRGEDLVAKQQKNYVASSACVPCSSMDHSYLSSEEDVQKRVSENLSLWTAAPISSTTEKNQDGKFQEDQDR